jgi:predicted NUDIX family NTP pyrophosphohydrolase
MRKRSAGLLMYRQHQGSLEVLLVHPGGPFWAKKDTGSWSIPKREFEPGEDPLEVARCEFEEETGVKSSGEFISPTPQEQPGGKIIFAWTYEGDYDVSAIKSNTFSME